MNTDVGRLVRSTAQVGLLLSFFAAAFVPQGGVGRQL